MHEIVLSDNVKPALEWVNNRVVQKVSPRPKHAFAQGQFLTTLALWARERGNGIAASEMHFQVRPPGEIGRTLVPDVAFVSYQRVSPAAIERNDIPRVAPDVVVEVRSPDDLKKDIDEKVRVYLAAGTDVIFLVDPEHKTVTIVDRSGMRTVSEDAELTHEALPGFVVRVGTLFELPRQHAG